MQKVTRIGVLSLARMTGGIGLGVGLLFGVMLAGASLFGATIGSDEAGLLGAFSGPVGALFVLPILYGTVTFLQGLVVGFVANLALGLFGGLELQISE